MSTTGTVAVIGAVATPTTAFAGYLFNLWRSKIDRTSTRQLALDAQEHELDVRRRERAYEARSDAYRHVLEWALRLIQQVELTDPIVSFTDQPGPPESLSTEHFDAMRTEVLAYGSDEVEQALEDYREKAQSFFLRNSTVRMIQGSGSPSIDLVGAYEQRDEARQAARDAFEALAAQIKRELSAL